MQKKRNRISVSLAVFFFISVFLFGCSCIDGTKVVLDGDTIELAGGERIRYIGIDTPELGHDDARVRRMARKAKRFNEELVCGKKLIFESDIEKQDKYGRTLAYVFLEDGTFVNAELVREGYALIMTIPPNFKYAGLLLKLQKEAEEGKRGFWSDEYRNLENIRRGYRWTR